MWLVLGFMISGLGVRGLVYGFEWVSEFGLGCLGVWGFGLEFRA